MRYLALSILLTIHFSNAAESTSGDYYPNQIIVKLAPETQHIANDSRATNIALLDNILSRFGNIEINPLYPHSNPQRADLPDISRIYLLKYENGSSPLSVAKAIKHNPSVLYAEPRYKHYEEEIPNDPDFSSQWHLSKIMAAAAWDIQHGDSNVVIGVVDGGFDMDHPDLEANYYTNLVEFNGTEGVDDDANGYMDDIRGWDFGGPTTATGPQPDNDPDHGLSSNSHGTHVAGLANAVTDNAVGVAGVAWNVEILPVKNKYDDSGSSVIFGYEGIVYAAEMGADIINCSWGGSGNSQYAQDIIDYAVGLGSIIVAAAGNDNSPDFHSPSGYRGVISVANTDPQDIRNGSSNYGISIDVAAPGTGVLSTYPNGNYFSISGTSMSSPVVAGLVALVKSAYPNLSNAELSLRVVATADNIDSQNPNYIGQLGTGRINALNALTYDTTQFVEIAPRIETRFIMATDTIQGNSNGIYDRDEIIHVSALLRNYAMGPASEFQIELTTQNTDLTILNNLSGTYSFPSDAEVIIENEISFQIHSDAEAGMAELNLNVYVDGVLHSNSPLLLLVGKTPVLMVDDDRGAGSNMEDFYTGIWDEQVIRYGVWDHSIQGSPSAEFLSAFPIVVWMCEWAFPTLDEVDRESLEQYLDLGGNLYISGQDLGWDLNENPGTPENISFFENYMHATWGGDNSGSMHVNGIYGDPISEGLSFNFYQPGYTSAQQYPDFFYPDSDAVIIFEYNNGRTMGLRYSGDYKLVYTGVGLETFGSDEFSNPATDINDIQRTVLNRILSYLNFIEHEAFTDTEDTTSIFDVSINVTGDINDLSSANLFYKNDSLSDFVEVAMADSGLGQYVATIPAPMNSSNIEYYIEIATTYYEWTNPVGAPTNVFLFHAGLDTIPPVVLSVSSIENRIDRSGAEQVVSFVSDNIGVDSVHLNWSSSVDPTVLHRTPMAFNGDSWVGDLVYENMPGNTIISYFVEAMDVSGGNMDYSQPLTFTIINTAMLTTWENQEIGSWDTGDGWGIQFINANYGYGMNDSPTSQYANNADNSLTLLEPYDLSDYNSAYLQFYSGPMLFTNEDFGYIELSDNGIDWTTVLSITGFSNMELTTLDVSEYIADGIYIRFRMTSDSANVHQGWFIDDITLVVDTTLILSSGPEITSLPAIFNVAQNFPNPFNPITTIHYDLPQRSNVQITIYDLLGREITTLVSETQDAGYRSVRWDATNVASGMYFYQIKAGDYIQTKKMLLLK